MSDDRSADSGVWTDATKSKLCVVFAGQPYELKVYGDWHDEQAKGRAKRAGVDLSTFQRSIILNRGCNPSQGGYFVRGHTAKDDYGRWLGFERRRDGKMQMGRSGNPEGYIFGKDAFLPPDEDRSMIEPVAT